MLLKFFFFSDEKKSYQKQIRPCPFCLKEIKNFSQHLLKAHKQEKEVIDISNIVCQSDKKRFFRKLMARGIEQYNDQILGSGIPLMRIRKTDHPESFCYMCENCKMIFKKNSISNHKRICNPNFSERKRGVIKCVNKTFMKKDTSFVESDFYENVFDKMHQDFVKEEFASDIELQYLGNFHYKKLKLRRTNKKAPSDSARRLIRIMTRFKIEYNKESSVKLNMSQIFDINNWIKTEKCIKKLIYNGDALKPGIAILLRSGIQISCDALLSFYTMYRPDLPGASRKEIVGSISEFLAQFNRVKSIVFGNIGEMTVERRVINRAAEELPTQETLEKIIANSNNILAKTSGKANMTTSMFIQMRRAVFMRLLFFNGRRPSELCNLTISQWDLCKNNYYLTSQQKASINSDALDTLLKHFRVIVTIGKSSDVPVVIPQILFNAVDLLCNENTRKFCKINKKNPYIFPSSLNSTGPSSGYDNFTQFLKTCDINQLKLSSVKARKLLANELASIDFPEDIRKIVYEFFGHGETLNKLHYCCPNLGSILDKIAPTLQQINDKYENCFNWEEEMQADGEKRIAEETERIEEERVEARCEINLKRKSAYANWTPRKIRRGPHDFFSSKHVIILLLFI